MSYIGQYEVDLFLQKKGAYLEKSKVNVIKNAITNSNVTYEELQFIKFKSPMIGLALSVLLGSCGIDRFYSGDYLLGFLKLCTGGGLGIWWIIDLFKISGAVKANNTRKLFAFLRGEELSNAGYNVTIAKNLVTSDKFRNIVKETVKATKDVTDTLDM